ncbi:MAG: methyltransferase domain-containing protein [Chloroflexota bacterium]|nr:MAG: methyltransferase domain-containing protein [Chloroflexota bacterium]
MMTEIDWVARWRALVEARHEQGQRLDRAHGRPDVWGGGRAARFSAHARESNTDDPILRHAIALAKDAVVLDVGSGPGRHTLPLARVARRVIALDTSPSMLALLRENVAREELTNVDIVEGGWPDVADAAGIADVVICSHALYGTSEVEPFIRALDRAARVAVFVQMWLGQRDGPWLDLFARVWNEPRRLAPNAIDLFNVAHSLGYASNFEVTPTRTWRQFRDLDDAVAQSRQEVLNPEGDGIDALVREVIEPTLTTTPDGVAFARHILRSGIVWWRKEQ